MAVVPYIVVYWVEDDDSPYSKYNFGDFFVVVLKLHPITRNKVFFSAYYKTLTQIINRFYIYTSILLFLGVFYWWEDEFSNVYHGLQFPIWISHSCLIIIFVTATLTKKIIIVTANNRGKPLNCTVRHLSLFLFILVYIISGIL